MRMIRNRAVDSDTIDIVPLKWNINENRHSTHLKYNNSGYKVINVKFNGDTKTLKEKNEKVRDDLQDEKEEEINQLVREQPAKFGITLRSGKRPNYKTISKPKYNMLIQLPMKTKKPEHVGEALRSNLREYWIECIYNCYDKIHNSTTLSCPLPRRMIPVKKSYYESDYYSKSR